MAKKVVAALQKGTKKLTKAIRMVKSTTSGSYVFEEKIMPVDKAKDFFAKK